MKFSDFLKSIDILSFRPQFLAGGGYRFQTLYGGTVSFLFFIFALVAFFYFLGGMIQRTNPTAYIDQSFSTKRNSTGKTDDFLFMFNILTPYHKEFHNQERLFTVEARFMNSTIGPLNDTTDDNLILSNTSLKLVMCNLTYLSKYNQFIKQLDVDSHFCLEKNQDFYLENSADDVNYHYYMTFSFFYCQNSTHNNNSCYSIEEANSIMSSMYAEIVFLDNYIDNSNFSSPIQYYAHTINFPVSYHSVGFDSLYFIDLEYTTDVGFVLETIEDNKALSFSNHEFVSLPQTPSPGGLFFQYDIMYKPFIQKGTRIYTKLQTILANIGGFINSLLVCAEMFIFFISQHEMNMTLYSNSLTLVKKLGRSSLKLTSIKNIQQIHIEGNPMKLEVLNFKSKSQMAANNNNINSAGLNNNLREIDLKHQEASNLHNSGVNLLTTHLTKTINCNNEKLEFILDKVKENKVDNINNFESIKFLFCAKCLKSRERALYYAYIIQKVEKYLDVKSYFKIHNDVKIIKKLFKKDERKVINLIGKNIYYKDRRSDEMKKLLKEKIKLDEGENNLSKILNQIITEIN